MNLIVGLGNPGPRYARTRHNVGFMVARRLVQRHALGEPKKKFHARMYDGRIAQQRVLVLEPMTYMNRSGLAVSDALRFYKLNLNQLMVVVDDTALPGGVIRLRPGGSAGGHNGLSDIEAALDDAQYPRLRFGVGLPRIGEQPVAQRDYVLSPFTEDQHEALENGLESACDALELWLTDGLDAAMNRFNIRVKQEDLP